MLMEKEQFLIVSIQNVARQIWIKIYSYIYLYFSTSQWTMELQINLHIQIDNQIWELQFWKSICQF